MNSNPQRPIRVSTRSPSPIDTLAHLDLLKLTENIGTLIYQPTVELIHAIRAGSFPWAEALALGSTAGLFIATHVDQRIFAAAHLSVIYPYRPMFYWPYCTAMLTLGFWGWALREMKLRNDLIERLTRVFVDAGLKSPLGSLPKFIFDKPVDAFTRKMRLYRAGLSFAQFEKARPQLESALQVYVDEIRENRESGTLDLIYAHCPMPTFAQLDNIRGIPALHFAVGKTRARQLTASFREVPHLLVAGQTGGGKSSFLREMIVTLYLNQSDLEFTLIDLKGGIEFQIFENLKRAHVIPDVERAIAALVRAEDVLKKRMVLLKEHGCKDIDAYQAMRPQVSLARQVIIIDEAAEMFLAGHHAKSADIQRARGVLSQIARLGRSVGVHLVIATQRPDSRALDPQVKANLTGVLCFQMQNDTSSITVLGVGRASDLPPISGRAIWKSGAEMTEVQVPYLSIEETNELLKEHRVPGASVAEIAPLTPIEPLPIHGDDEVNHETH
ncbi:FtsK/SpoIIIE domain-containing protein [Bdellovibrionota bacterium FG-1]